jgi:alkanesulfonate monooxygenase SsuD/methylene tetrahydromethanopterin reductase-like flavin-dependent oxidoreductase (luciferase family)
MSLDNPAPGLRRSIVFSTDALEPIIELAQHAERRGFSRVWTTEYPHRDAVIRSLAIAMNTQTIEIGTGVAYAFARLPLAMAAMTADVQRLSAGRFALGVSAGTRGVRRWFGADFEPPAAALTAYVTSLREAWARNGELAVTPPVFGAALGPVMGRRVAETFDGVLLHPLALARVHLRERLLPAVAKGTGTRGDAVSLVAWCITSVDLDAARARARARAQLAFYFSTPSYASVSDGTDWNDIPHLVQTAFLAGDRKALWTELGALIPDRVVDELTLSGTPSDVAARAVVLERELAELGITEVAFAAAGADMTSAEFTSSCDNIITALAVAPVSEPSPAGVSLTQPEVAGVNV